MAGRTMDTSMKAEAAFIMYAVSKGWEVSKPIHHAQSYDFVIRKPECAIWETVQVKAAYQGKDGRGRATREVSLRRCNEKGSRPYSDGDFDWLFVWDGFGSLWFLPWGVVKKTRSTITLGNSDHVNHANFMVNIS
jgi:hypothetical protein